jgi:hypothetical protein
MVRDIDAPNEEMATQGVGIFAGGLKPIARAQSLRLAVDGETFLIKEPCPSTGEHVHGFWGRKAAIACAPQ